MGKIYFSIPEEAILSYTSEPVPRGYVGLSVNTRFQVKAGGSVVASIGFFGESLGANLFLGRDLKGCFIGHPHHTVDDLRERIERKTRVLTKLVNSYG